MNKHTHSKLIFYFAGIVFVIIFVTVIIMSCIAFLLYKRGILPSEIESNGFPLVALLFLSLLIGAGISLFVGSKIIKPITELTEVTKRVAEGEFDVRVAETGSIAEVREMTRNFNKMINELSGIETLRNDFIVNVSHEFKTPIAAIEGYATLLQSDDLSIDEHREYVQMIIDSSRQLSALSGNILNLSKLESQEIIPNKKNFSLDEQIRLAILFLEKEWSSKNLHLEIDLNTIDFYGDEAMLLQVWTNLIGNAIKFTDNNGTIKIRLFAKEPYAVVEIVDTGRGMNENTIKRIFDKFYQGDTTRRSDGNGLGLTLAKRILDLFNGIIEVESKIGEGSTFRVLLPVHNID